MMINATVALMTKWYIDSYYNDNDDNDHDNNNNNNNNQKHSESTYLL